MPPVFLSCRNCMLIGQQNISRNSLIFLPTCINFGTPAVQDNPIGCSSVRPMELLELYFW